MREAVERIRAQAQQLNERKTILEQELSAIAAGRENMKRLNARLKAAQHERSLYNELRAAFSRNGLPALIIETAIPELEAEADELLSRMTDGGMRLRLSTQREKVTGGIAETLDIEIADELGRVVTSYTAAAKPSASTSPCASPFRSCWRGARARSCGRSSSTKVSARKMKAAATSWLMPSTKYSPILISSW